MSKLKKFKSTLRKDLSVRRTGLLGFGRKIEVKGDGLTYRVDKSQADEETAALINSKMPCAIIRPAI